MGIGTNGVYKPNEGDEHMSDPNPTPDPPFDPENTDIQTEKPPGQFGGVIDEENEQ